MTLDWWHIIPGPLMVCLLMAIGGWTIWLYTTKDKKSPQKGTSLRILSTILLLCIAPNIFTDWVNWPMNGDSSRANYLKAKAETISVTLNSGMTVTISKADWQELTDEIDALLVQISELQKSISK